MKPLVRRRLLASAAVAATALVGGLLVAPNGFAAPNGLVISPNAAQNTNPSRSLTFTGTDTDFSYGADVTFNRIAGGAPFVVTTPATTLPLGKTPSATANVNFTDVGNGLGSDGPADAGVYNVTAVGRSGTGLSPGGGTDNCSSCFTVLSAGPVVVTSVAPNSLRPGARGNVSVLGNNFERGTVLQFLFPGTGDVDTAITVGAPTADNTDTGNPQTDKITTRTELKRRLTVGAGSAPGSRDVRVFNLDGTTSVCSGCFFVAGPSLTSVTPTGDFNDPGQPLTTLTFSGPNVANGQPSLEFVGNPGGSSRATLAVPGQNVRNYTGTSITADFDLANAAPQGSGYQPFVRDSSGVVNACDMCRFTVIQRDSRMPTVANLDSDTATAGIQRDIRQGQTVTFAVNGTNFSKGAALTISGTGLTVNGVEFVAPEQVLATITASANASTGPRDVTVTLTDGKTSNTCTGCINVVTSASPSPSSSASPSGSATPSATATSTIRPSGSPSPSGCPGNGLTVRVNTPTINATGLASVTVSGARSGSTVELQGYSQDHFLRQNFDNDQTPVDRTGVANSDGTVTFNDLRPASNTRLRARQAGCTYNDQTDVINVRAQETLEVTRNRSLTYTFSGKSIPARPGGLIVSLYRITGQPCPAGVEPRQCAGEKFVGQNRARSDNGRYSITITFDNRDRNTRDEFVVKTGQDAQNAPGRSNVRSLAIF